MDDDCEDDIFKYIFFNENVWISTTISLKFVFKGLIASKWELIQVRALRQTGDKSLSITMMTQSNDAYMRQCWPFHMPLGKIILWLYFPLLVNNMLMNMMKVLCIKHYSKGTCRFKMPPFIGTFLQSECFQDGSRGHAWLRGVRETQWCVCLPTRQTWWLRTSDNSYKL